MPEETGIEGWLFNVAIRKVITRIVILVSSYIFTVKGIALLHTFGIQIDQAQFQNEVNVAIYAGIAWLHDWAKVRYGWKWL